MKITNRNVLNSKQRYELCKALESGVDGFKGMSAPKIAQVLTEKLGFLVRDSNVINIRDQLDLNICKVDRNPKMCSLDDAHTLQTRIIELQIQVEFLASQISRLVLANGETPNIRLAKLAEREMALMIAEEDGELGI